MATYAIGDSRAVSAPFAACSIAVALNPTVAPCGWSATVNRGPNH